MLKDFLNIAMKDLYKRIKNEIWYGDQRTYDNILREELNLLPTRDPPKKYSFKLGSYIVRGCKNKTN